MILFADIGPLDCHGTVNFMKVCYTLNIPVEYINLSHTLPYFVHEGLYLSHGDPYCNTWRSSDVPIPASELLIRSAEYQEHFRSKKKKKKKNIVLLARSLLIKKG